MQFHPKQVVWAKVKGYPWWPAYINKLPQDSDGNFKVIFFAEDTYALLEPRCVQKFSQNYAEYSKTKAKKFTKALQLANNASNRPFADPKPKKNSSNKKKSDKKQEIECQPESQSPSIESQSLSLDKEVDFDHISQNQQLLAMADDTLQQIDRKKIQRIQCELSEIIAQFQNNRLKQWKYSSYFEKFKSENSLNSQELLHSNITRKIRFIIQNMKRCKFDHKEVQKLQHLSQTLKLKVLDYLTDTTYYDQHIKLIDKSKHNKVEIQAQITKILRKKYEGIRKDFIIIFASQIGSEVGKKTKFRSKQLLNNLKDGAYDMVMKNLNSKAATLRIADQIIQRYRQ